MPSLGPKSPLKFAKFTVGPPVHPHGALCLQGGVGIFCFLFSCCLPTVGEIFQRLLTKEKPKKRPVGIGAFRVGGNNMSPLLKKRSFNGFSEDWNFLFLPEKAKILSVGHQDVGAKEGRQCPWGELSVG